MAKTKETYGDRALIRGSLYLRNFQSGTLFLKEHYIFLFYRTGRKNEYSLWRVSESALEPKCTLFMYIFFRGRISFFLSLPSIPGYVHDIPTLLSTLQNPKISCLHYKVLRRGLQFSKLEGSWRRDYYRCWQQKIRFTFSICLKIFNVECSGWGLKE